VFAEWQFMMDTSMFGDRIVLKRRNYSNKWSFNGRGSGCLPTIM